VSALGPSVSMYLRGQIVWIDTCPRIILPVGVRSRNGSRAGPTIQCPIEK
jgi:hypothetical protein